MIKCLKESPSGRWWIVNGKGIGLSMISAHAAELIQTEFDALTEENTRLREAISNHLSVADEIMAARTGEHHGCWLEKSRFDRLRHAAEGEVNG